jgi:hypothetical protein
LLALPHDRTGRLPGPGRFPSAEQAELIQRLLRSHSPEELGIPAPVWNARAVRDLIRQQCQVSLAGRTVGFYLRCGA